MNHILKFEVKDNCATVTVHSQSFLSKRYFIGYSPSTDRIRYSLTWQNIKKAYWNAKHSCFIFITDICLQLTGDFFKKNCSLHQIMGSKIKIALNCYHQFLESLLFYNVSMCSAWHMTKVISYFRKEIVQDIKGWEQLRSININVTIFLHKKLSCMVDYNITVVFKRKITCDSLKHR